MNNVQNAPGEKITKLQGGDAYISVGKDYIRIGNGESYILLDGKSIHFGANSVNWEMSPENMTYHGIIRNPNVVEAFIPFYPHYSFSTTPFVGLANTLITSALVSSAIGIAL